MPLPSARANEEDNPSEEEFSFQVQSGKEEYGDESSCKEFTSPESSPEIG